MMVIAHKTIILSFTLHKKRSKGECLSHCPVYALSRLDHLYPLVDMSSDQCWMDAEVLRASGITSFHKKILTEN